MAQAEETKSMMRRSLIAVGAAALVILVLVVGWQISRVLLIVFGAVLGSVFIDALARPAQMYMRLPRGLALALAFLVTAAVVAAFGFAAGPQLAAQTEQLTDILPRSLARLRDWVAAQPLGQFVVDIRLRELFASPSQLLGQISGIFSTTLGTLANVVLIAVLTVYMVVEADLYREGFLRLLPANRRGRGREVVAAIAHALRWWILGRATSMLAVGVLTLIGLTLIGMPAALALAVLAGLLSFIPYIGPILSAVPAILIALGDLPWQPVWVLAIYAGVQFLEGNVITPLIQERAVALPPVVLLVSQLAFGVLFGLMGVLLAAPMAVVLIVLIQMLYIEGWLGEPVRVLGEHHPHRG